jgi:rRNA maturation protein Nop10
MESKKIVILTVLIAVVIVAAVLTVKRTTSGPAVPAWVMDQQVEKIDIKSLEVITARLGDWDGKYAPDASGLWKNPKTGEYTMAGVMKCAACGQLIPVPQQAAGKGTAPGTMATPQTDYKCPRCGKNAFGFPSPGQP